MACKYYYKNHEFQSELELDDFLLEKLPFEPVLGDLVFSMSQAQLNISVQLSSIAKESHKLQSRYKEMLKSAEYDEDGNILIEDPPYIGVNKFLSGLKNQKGDILFPEFRQDEYWKRRYSNWKLGQYTDAEIEEFGLDKNNLPKINDSQQQEQFRKQMTKRWEVQAKTGSAIHNVLQICFQKQKGIYNYTLSDAELIKLIDGNIEDKNKPYLTKEAIDQTIEYARNLYKDLVYKLGDDNLAFYPEFMVTQDTNVISNGKPTTLMGIIDLLIVDSTGKIHILDYKTSIHDYGDFSGAKRLAYSYQLSTYQRMLQKYGLNTYEGQLFVAPIQIRDFKKDGDTYTYNGILAPVTFTPINSNISNMWENIDEFMPAPFKVSVSTKEIVSTTSEMMGKWFKDNTVSEIISKEQVIKKLERYKAFEKDEDGNYVWKKYGKEKPITAKTKEEFIDKVFKYEQSLPAQRVRYTAEVKNSLKEAMSNGIQNVRFPSPVTIPKDGSVTWLQDVLSPYCNGAWEIQDKEELESFGIIMLKTKDTVHPEQIDLIRVSTNDLTYNYRDRLDKSNPLRERKGLTGTYEPDVIQKSKSNSLMVESVNGNIELMETLLVLNQTNGLEGHTIGNIQVVNPLYATGMYLSNEELLYCWNELNKHDSVKDNKLSNGTIKFATKYELVRQMFRQLLIEGEERDWKDGYQIISQLRGCTSILDENIKPKDDEKLDILKDLLKKLNVASTNRGGINFLDRIYTDQSQLKSKEVALHNAILYAIGQLKGVNFRQQLKDHDSFIESLIVWKNGVSGTYIDNPGNMDSETLNLVTKLVTEAYQNVRDELQKEKVTVSKLVNNLKKEKQFGYAKENTVGNQVSLYSNMTYVSKDGDFLFKNPKNLSPAERDFLRYALYKINKNRFPSYTDEQLQEMEENDNIDYYRVPLARGDSDSVASTNGMLSVLRSKLRYLKPSEAFKKAREKAEGIFNAEEDTRDQQKSQLLFKMTNMFDEGEGKKRLEMIERKGVENLEHNLETLLYKHIFAYSVKDNIDGVFPMIKAAMVHISTQGATQNTEFSQDNHYLSNYIRNKIFNQSIVDPKLQSLSNKLGLLKQAASKFTLAFSPVQALYQPLQGLWTDISLMIRKPDGTNAFTREHFLKSLKMVYSDLSHYSDSHTLCSALNELFGINDMDMNSYIDRISTAKKGVWNADNLMFKFASRPDYYNRMTIFLAQMMGDGCLDAVSINSEGQLEYDWTKDARFSKFAAAIKVGNGNSSDPEISKQRSLYYTVAKQFVIEHAKNKNGEDFKLDMSNPEPLPRAYTNKQAESMKSLADDIYGYYSHEKKSLIMSTVLGSMWLQFKTYWSGKKNQYLQSGGVRLRGTWEHYYETVTNPETGKVEKVYYYYQVDDKGNILYDEPPTTKETIAPVIQWKGQWQEGIILTISDMVRNTWNISKEEGIMAGLKEGWNSKWNNEDDNLRRAYRNNIKQLWYDIMMFIIGGCIIGAMLGDWLDDLKKENVKNKDFSTGLALAAANVAVLSVKNSFLDFNAFETIGGPISSWQPFALSWSYRVGQNIVNVALKDEDAWDGFVKSHGATKQIKPVLDAIKPDMFRTKREGGTFGVE